MTEKGLEGFIEIRHPVDAVPYPKFAEMIGKKPATVKSMIEDGKLPIVPWRSRKALALALKIGFTFLNLTAEYARHISAALLNSGMLGFCGLGFERQTR